jgi:hypothetical protein
MNYIKLPDACSICTNPFINTVCTITNCNHKFHTKCLSNHKKSNYGNKCPLCKNQKYYDIEAGLNDDLIIGSNDDSAIEFLQECLPSCTTVLVFCWMILHFIGICASIFIVYSLIVGLVALYNYNYNIETGMYLSISILINIIYSIVNISLSNIIQDKISVTRSKYGRKFTVILCYFYIGLFLALIWTGIWLLNNNKINRIGSFKIMLYTNIIRLVISSFKLLYFASNWPEYFVENSPAKFNAISSPTCF